MEKYYKYGFFVAILIAIAFGYKSCSDNKALSSVKLEESNLRKALTDTLTYFKTKDGNWGVEKKTLQTELSTLKDNNLNLNANQKALIKEVERQNKTATTIAAALIELRAEVNGLKNDKPTLQTDSTVQFAPKIGDAGYDKDFEYDLTIANVKRFELKPATLKINRVSFPNTQTVNFNWKDDKKEGYPVSFSVTNTNKYFQVNNIDSYILPEITREKIKPTFWQNFNNKTKTTGGKITIFVIGVGVGALLIK